MNDPVVLVLVAILPSVVVFLTAFYTLKQFMNARAGERLVDLKKDDRKQTLPLRLQAYERIALFLERIAPGALVLRVHKSNMTSRMLHAELIATVREELEHNVTQQVYMSDKAWAKVKQAKEETIRLINLSYEQTGDNPSATELSRKIFENASRLSHTPSQEALLVIKDEVRRLF
jgi:predicted AlkP superfamily phosphohydrolase/phosphomutase